MSSPIDNLSCDYCGLPVPQPLWTATTTAVDKIQPAYCCYGCRLAHSITQERGEVGSARWTLTRLGIGIFFAMNVMVFTLALWSYDSGQFDTTTQMAASFKELLRSICLVLSLPVLFLLGKPLIENAIDQLRSRRFSTDLLLLSGILAAYGYSIVAVWTGEGPLYFEVGCIILVFVTLGRWLEATGKLKSTQALDQLQNLLPDIVQRLTANGNYEEVPRSQIKIGDQLRVKAGDRFPCDGVLTSSRTTVDEQLLTGESWPVEKSHGNPLTGGTVNLDGDVVLEVDGPPDAGTLDRLVQAVRLARESQGDYQKLADRYSSWFFPFVVVIALIAFIVHSIVSGVMAGIMVSLAVFLIACPCALGLATPMAIWAAVGAAARRGIVIQGGSALERLADINAIRFDKTGTLTNGSPVVEQMISESIDPKETVFELARILADSSSHIFSQCILRYVKQHKDSPEATDIELSDIQSHPGAGVSGRWKSATPNVALGNPRMMSELSFELSEFMDQTLRQTQLSGKPIVLIGWSGSVRGMFILHEELRANAAQVVDEFRSRGLNIGILTGDHVNSARHIAEQLKIPVQAELSPSDKSTAIRELQEQSLRVALIGDGVNDAPALALADVGISLGCGADVTRDSADICLISNDLTQLPWLLELSARTISTIRSNLRWAFGYNSLGILLASTGWLHPAFAAILMVGSSFYVISNSLRLSADFAPESDFNSNDFIATDNSTESVIDTKSHTQPEEVLI